MENLKIHCFPDKILRQKTEKVTRIDNTVRELSEKMLEIMKEASGIGLASNQVGKLLRVAVIGNLPDILDEPLILINPEINDFEDWTTQDEGCLSFPGVSTAVRRRVKVYATFWNLKEEEMKIEARGILARAIQHELDHLDGILFPDHLSFLSRQLLLQKYRRRKKKAPSF
ncbi:MAG: peptide deformylase [Candidatus Omnitrophica bacterium]|nr:peptide deformylase [Candidatus Omnitrophota bacterium]